MPNSAFRKHIAGFRLKTGKPVSLEQLETAWSPKGIDKENSAVLLQESIKELSEMQQLLYAHNRYSILIIFQAMDAAGKDGAIRHVMSGLNPQGVKVTSFKIPSSNELDHDYLWRHYLELPARGEIGIFNRSHYENVLVTRVHPEYIAAENLPAVNNSKDIDKHFWKQRFRQINNFEQHLAENGTVILKFFLHLSKEEQKKRFLERIDDPAKNWKFSAGDLGERKFWAQYQSAYESMMEHTNTKYAPWLIIPADNKWSARLAISELILQEIESMKMHYPALNKQQKTELQKAREILLSEEDQD
jgi:PPK2 family polyphosphate:nucleotide phosphotransferase